MNGRPDPLQELTLLTSAVVRADWELLRRVRTQTSPEGPDRRWREALLQCHLFCGFPRVVEAFEVLEPLGGLGPVDEEELEENVDRDRGHELFDRIYGEQAPVVRSRLQEFHPQAAAWIAEHAYRRVLARPGLEPVERELLAVTALLLTGHEQQLISHVRGALRLGASLQDLEVILTTLEDHCPPETLELGQRVLDRLSS